MTLQVRLYGKLRDLASDHVEASGKIGLIEFEDRSIEKISDVLEFLGVDEEEISHIFLNGEYSGKDRKLGKGDRLALFSKDMSLLYKWYFSEKGGD
ncbi:hypothetical protein AKJ57_02365 [candidate division MSBL1 archaeon SCGC-AAA259A05]|uniref:Ubiquitin Mut7-C domain-containing protein n=1 Tax=candidate division MSBL1 archaeon SCGC-AAA259A05 TaxID=1698259 RepID=A0A133UA93_9EURY|nr:hypothetical protein AKJ57_02365 [candidate division MSBL1 archaeon SCGC-AAA259A05]